MSARGGGLAAAASDDSSAAVADFAFKAHMDLHIEDAQSSWLYTDAGIPQLWPGAVVLQL
jgi:hypothetical protein